MAITYYADFDLTTGANNGTSPTDAWKTFADVCAGTNGIIPADGDTVLMRGTDNTFASNISFIGINGVQGSFIKFIGVNSSWVNDNNYSNAILDLGIYQVSMGDASYTWFENITFKRSDGGAGVNWAQTEGASSGQVFMNVFFNTCYPYNYFGTASRHIFYRCRVENAANGFMARNAYAVVGCVAKNCTGYGFYSRSTQLVYGNISIGNDLGYRMAYDIPALINCIAYSNTTAGIYLGTFQYNNLVGNRIVDNGVAIANQTDLDIVYYIGNYFDNPGTSPNFTGVVDILNEFSGTDVDGGFNSPSTGDLNLTSAATMRDVEIELP